MFSAIDSSCDLEAPDCADLLLRFSPSLTLNCFTLLCYYRSMVLLLFMIEIIRRYLWSFRHNPSAPQQPHITFHEPPFDWVYDPFSLSPHSVCNHHDCIQYGTTSYCYQHISKLLLSSHVAFRVSFFSLSVILMSRRLGLNTPFIATSI